MFAPCAMFLIRPCRQVEQSRDSHKRIILLVRRRQEILETKSCTRSGLNIRPALQTSTGLFFLVFLSFFSSKKTIENLSVRMLYLDSSRAFAMWLVFKPINTAGFYSASFLTETYAKFGNIFVLFIS